MTVSWPLLLRRGKYYSEGPLTNQSPRNNHIHRVFASLLYLPGIVPVFTLPGDRMFQSTGILANVQGPVILHAYMVEQRCI